ncbi:MAG: glycosyltransferase family 9 protein [Bryobacteraceae bacterium]
MESISALDLAQQVVDTCVAEGTWPGRVLDALIERALGEDKRIAAEASRAFFSVVIERLADLFEPRLCDVYARLFSLVIARALPEFQAADLIHRYRRVAQVRRYQGSDVERVYVLSRITLGADVAVTSVVLDAMKRRFPDAEICFVGPSKNAELFLDDARILPISVVYGRSALLLDRLVAAKELQDILDDPASLVIDPDSRLTQLGLIPVCDDARYFFFESRAYGGDSDESLPQLTSNWLTETFGHGGHAYLAPEPDVPEPDDDLELKAEQPDRTAAVDGVSHLHHDHHPGAISVSLGVGENEEKRIDDEFEEAVLRKLLSLNRPVVIDHGAGGAEAERVDKLIQRLDKPPNLIPHTGTFSSFTRQIVTGSMYFGYDSAGQHVAAAARVPLVSVFCGYASERMFARWKPWGDGVIQTVPVRPDDRDTVLERTFAAICSVAEEAGLL